MTGTGVDNHGLVRVAAWAGFAALLVVGATVLRLVTHDRFVVSDVSAGGATVKLSERTPTYFDEYLDDIVNYFDSEDIDIVIFEDLDRFNDPHIFEALRELNTLLNNTNKRTGKATHAPVCVITVAALSAAGSRSPTRSGRRRRSRSCRRRSSRG